jgi:hypothetical protein
VDYQDLVPARPWLDEIHRGIQSADIFLLVVSKASVLSPNVAEETQKALELKKRIILLIFESAKLPPALEQCEWVDFRRRFRRGINELLKRVESPREQKERPPQAGFKAPIGVWFAFLVSH